MKVVVFAPFALYTPHFETDLEIVQKHLRAGDDVRVLVCDSELETCETNLNHERSPCLGCICKRMAGLQLLSPGAKIGRISRLTRKDRAELDRLKTNFANIEDLRAFAVGGFDIGMAALSTIISVLRDPEPDLDQHRVLLANLLRSALRVYRSFQREMSVQRADRVYVFNGRFPILRAVLRVCQEQKVECFVHERACDIHHYGLWRNHMPHDRNYYVQQIQASWEAANGVSQRESIAASWFDERSLGIDRAWIPFVAGQRQGMLPDDWNPSRENVAIFPSSEDEFVAAGEGWQNPLYSSQTQGLRALISSLQNRSHNLHLYIRVHPNLATASDRQILELNSLAGPFSTVIPAKHEVSTYALMRSAGKVLTYGSTTGIEASYWRKPSILAGMSLYRELNSTYNPRSHSELVEMLCADLAPTDRLGSLKYGYYHATFGEAFEFFRADGLNSGTFKGKALYAGRFTRLQAKIARLKAEIRSLLVPSSRVVEPCSSGTSARKAS